MSSFWVSIPDFTIIVANVRTGLLTVLQKLAKLSSDDTSVAPDYFGGRKAAIAAS